MKLCTKCNNVKPLAQFYASKTHKDGYHCYCKPCESLRSKAKNQLNKTNRLAKAKEWRKNNKEAFYASIERWRLAHPNKHQELMKSWAANNRDKVNAKWMRREANKKQRTPAWLTKEQHKQIEVEYSLANWCTKVTKTSYHVDHIVPLQGKTVCGLHVPWNLQVLPAKLNQQKSNRLEK